MNPPTPHTTPQRTRTDKENPAPTSLPGKMESNHTRQGGRPNRSSERGGSTTRSTQKHVRTPRTLELIAAAAPTHAKPVKYSQNSTDSRIIHPAFTLGATARRSKAQPSQTISRGLCSVTSTEYCIGQGPRCKIYENCQKR